MRNLKIVITVLSLVLIPLLSVQRALSMEEHTHPETKLARTDEVVVKPNEVVFRVYGVVCSFCAQGIQKKFKKIDFVDTSKYNDGTLTNIENQLLTVAIKEGAGLNIPYLKEEILKAGYEPVSAQYLDAENKQQIISWEK